MDAFSFAALLIALLVVFLASIAGIVVWIANFRAPWQIDMLKNHYAAIVGLPAAAAGSFVLSILARQISGDKSMKVSIGTFNIEGPAGPVLLWVVCFLAMAFAIRIVWPLKP